MISAWILVGLTILAVNVGHRVSMFTRLSRYQRDSVKALAAAKAGINTAVEALLIDQETAPQVDGFSEAWANNQEKFEKIVVGDSDPNVYATVQYTIEEESITGASHEEGEMVNTTMFGAGDEQSKINVNTATGKLLAALLAQCNVNSPEEIVSNLLLWRGTPEPGFAINPAAYADLNYDPKGKLLNTLEELLLVKDMTPEIFQQIQQFLTVCGDGTININTAGREVLAAVATEKNPGQDGLIQLLVDSILKIRANNDLTTTEDDLQFANTGELKAQLGDTDQQNLFSTIESSFGVTSSFFRIQATGTANGISKEVVVMYDRSKNKFKSWNEN